MTRRCDSFHNSINSLLESAEKAANGTELDKRLKRNLLPWSLLSKKLGQYTQHHKEQVSRTTLVAQTKGAEEYG